MKCCSYLLCLSFLAVWPGGNRSSNAGGFTFIEEQTEQGAPKYMEWYGAAFYVKYIEVG